MSNYVSSTKQLRVGQIVSTTTKFGTTTSNNMQTQALISHRTGEDNPRWKSQIRAGTSATTPLSGIRYVIARNKTFSASGDWKASSYPYAPGFSSSVVGQIDPSYRMKTDSSLLSAPSSNVDNTALATFHKRLNSAFAQIQSGVMAAESRETAGMIVHRGDALKKGISDYLRRVKKLARRYRKPVIVLRHISETWLEYNFGWAPLLSDIDDAIGYINDNGPFRTSSVVMGAATDTISDYTGNGEIVGSPYITEKGSYRVNTTTLVKYKGQISCQDGRGPSEFQKLSLAPENWLPTFYEIIPYTWAIDYFSNLDGIVSAIGNFLVTPNWAYKTVRKEQRHLAVGTSVEYYPEYGVYEFEPGSETLSELDLRKIGVVRTPLAEVPFPSLTLSWPETKKQLANLSAVAALHLLALESLQPYLTPKKGR